MEAGNRESTEVYKPGASRALESGFITLCETSVDHSGVGVGGQPLDRTEAVMI